jgi:hypothetical protein
MAGGVGRSVAGISPTGECQDRNGVAQLRMADPLKMRHPDTLSDHRQ